MGLKGGSGEARPSLPSFLVSSRLASVCAPAPQHTTTTLIFLLPITPSEGSSLP